MHFQTTSAEKENQSGKGNIIIFLQCGLPKFRHATENKYLPDLGVEPYVQTPLFWFKKSQKGENPAGQGRSAAPLTLSSRSWFANEYLGDVRVHIMTFRILLLSFIGKMPAISSNFVLARTRLDQSSLTIDDGNFRSKFTEGLPSLKYRFLATFIKFP